MQIKFKLSEKEFEEEEIKSIRNYYKNIKMNFVKRFFAIRYSEKIINSRYKTIKKNKKYIGGTCLYFSKKILINLEKIFKNTRDELRMIKTIEEVITHEALHYTLRRELKNKLTARGEEKLVTKLAEESLSLK